MGAMGFLHPTSWGYNPYNIYNYGYISPHLRKNNPNCALGRYLMKITAAIAWVIHRSITIFVVRHATMFFVVYAASGGW